MTTSTTAETKLTFEAVSCRLTVLDGDRPVDLAEDDEIESPTYFAVTIAQEVQKRYLYLLQQEASDAETNGFPALLALLDQGEAPAGGGLRLPPGGGWQRAMIHGTVRVLASDKLVTPAEIRDWLGWRGTPPTHLNPPY